MINIKDLTNEELTKVITETPDKDFEMNFGNDPTNIAEFCIAKRITHGNALVPAYYIYYIYRKEWQPYSRKKLRKVDFFRRFSKVFVQIRHNHTRYYKLDGTYLNLNKEYLKDVKKVSKILATLDATLSRKFKHEKKPKRQTKISSTPETVQFEN